MITNIEDYFTKGCDRCPKFETSDCSTQIWADGLAQLRRLCLDAGLVETVKWGHPCYMHNDRNIAIFGAFRHDFRLTFFNAALMTDPEGVLEPAGPNTATSGVMRFTSSIEASDKSDIIRAYLAEAMGYATKGINPPKSQTEYDIPDELTEALDGDPTLAEAFAALTPGRQRGYFMHIGSAKQSTTRTARIEKCRERIYAGKGFNER